MTPLALSHVVGWVILGAIALVIVVGLARLVWSLMRGDRELESGGSMGHQMTDPLEDPAPTDVE